MSLICQASSCIYLSHALTNATRLQVVERTQCIDREMGSTSPDIKFALKTFLISPYQLQIKMLTLCPPCEIYEIVLIVQIIVVQLCYYKRNLGIRIKFQEENTPTLCNILCNNTRMDSR